MRSEQVIGLLFDKGYSKCTPNAPCWRFPPTTILYIGGRRVGEFPPTTILQKSVYGGRITSKSVFWGGLFLYLYCGYKPLFSIIFLQV